MLGAQNFICRGRGLKMKTLWSPHPCRSDNSQAQEMLLGLGSNCQPEVHLRLALQWLQSRFGRIERSVVYESAAIGFAGDPFHNLVIALHYEGELGALRNEFKTLEDDLGRDRSQPKFSPRNLDLDILTWGGCVGWFEGIELPRTDCFFNSYVLRPLAELRPHQKVPGRTSTWQQLWEQCAPDAQPLTRVEDRYLTAGASLAVL